MFPSLIKQQLIGNTHQTGVLAHISDYRNITWHHLDFLFRAKETSFDLGITLFNLVQLPSIFKLGPCSKWISRQRERKC